MTTPSSVTQYEYPVPKFEHPSVSGKASRSTLVSMTPSAPRSGGSPLRCPYQNTARRRSVRTAPSPERCRKRRCPFRQQLLVGVRGLGRGGIQHRHVRRGAVSAAASGTSAAMAASLAMLLLRSVPLRHTAAPPKTIQAHAATDTTCCQCRCTTRRRFFTGASAARIRSSSTWPMASNNSRSVTVQHPFPVSRQPACRACGAASPAPCSRSGRTARQCPPSRRSTSTGAKICCAFPPAACAETR